MINNTVRESGPIRAPIEKDLLLGLTQDPLANPIFYQDHPQCEERYPHYDKDGRSDHEPSADTVLLPGRGIEGDGERVLRVRGGRNVSAVGGGGHKST